MTGKRNTVIAGAGRVGWTTARRVADHGDDVIIIERDEQRCEELTEEYVATVIQGDASDPTILEQASIEDQDVVGAFTDETGTNLAICLEAKEMNPDIRTVVRVDRPPGTHYDRFADEVVYPEDAGSRAAVNVMVGDDVQTLEEAPGDLELVYVRVAEDAPAAGEQIADVQFPDGSRVISAARGDRVATPETTLESGERYVVAVESDVADEVMNLLRS